MRYLLLFILPAFFLPNLLHCAEIKVKPADGAVLLSKEASETERLPHQS